MLFNVFDAMSSFNFQMRKKEDGRPVVSKNGSIQTMAMHFKHFEKATKSPKADLQNQRCLWGI